MVLENVHFQNCAPWKTWYYTSYTRAVGIIFPTIFMAWTSVLVFAYLLGGPVADIFGVQLF